MTTSNEMRPQQDEDHAGTHTIDVAVIGGGQAGLATAYGLRQAGIRSVVLDEAERIGDAWRRRWQSLRLFTPAAYDALPGRPFPASASTYPTKDEMADYLEAYAVEFDLPVMSGMQVRHVVREERGFRIETAARQTWQAESVVLATGAHQAPSVPDLAASLEPGIRQLHSSEYRDPSQLADGPVLVVGAGNSGSEIAIEAAATGRRTWLAGRSTGHIPGPVYVFNGRIMMFFARHLLTRDTPIGRKVGARMLGQGGPLIRLTPGDITRAGVVRVGRIDHVDTGAPVAEGVGRLEPRTVVWATGYRPDLDWIEPSVLDAEGRIAQDRGVAARVPGLYFVGQTFQTGFTSALVDGAGRDAERVVRAIVQRRRPRSEAREADLAPGT